MQDQINDSPAAPGTRRNPIIVESDDEDQGEFMPNGQAHWRELFDEFIDIPADSGYESENIDQ